MKSLKRHFNYLLQLKEQGKIILGGRTQLDTDDVNNKGICIFECENMQEAGTIMNYDPAIKEAMMQGEVYPFKVVIEK